MCRRTAFYQTPVRSALALIIVCFLTVVVDATEPAGLFLPANVPTLEWDEFAAAGFSQPVSGIVFDGEHPAWRSVAWAQAHSISKRPVGAGHYRAALSHDPNPSKTY